MSLGIFARYLLAAALIAQSPLHTLDAQEVPTVHAGDRIRFHALPPNVTFEARFLGSSADSMWFVETCDLCPRSAVARSDVHDLTADLGPHQHRTLRGALWGVLGGAAFAALTSIGCHEEECAIAVLFAPVFSLAGGFLGAIVGSHDVPVQWIPAQLPALALPG